MSRCVKFDECPDCLHYQEGNNDVCDECDSGEQFEEADSVALNFHAEVVNG